MSNPSNIGIDVFLGRKEAQILKYSFLYYPWMKFYQSFMCGIPTEVSLLAQWLLERLWRISLHALTEVSIWNLHWLVQKKIGGYFTSSFKSSIFEHSLPTPNLSYINNIYIQKSLP